MSSHPRDTAKGEQQHQSPPSCWRRPFRRLQPQGLRAQLLLSTTLPVLVFLLALAFVGLYAFTRVTQHLVEERDAELVQLSAAQVADHWAETLLLLSQVAATEELRSGDAIGANELLAANDALLRRFDALHVTDVAGQIIAGTTEPPFTSLAEQDVFTVTRNQRRPVRSPVLYSSQGPVVLVAVPVYDSFRQFGGCLVGEWRLGGEGLGSALGTARTGSGAYPYLVDSEGTILWHPNPSLAGARLADHPAVSNARVGEQGAETVDEDGRTVVVGYAPIPANMLTSSLFADSSWQGWALLIAEPWENITAPYQPYLLLILLLLVLMIVAPLVVLAFSSQRVIAPLQSLVDQVERVASGEYAIQVSVNRGPSEVRNLEVKFNEMVRRLSRYQADIQSYVSSVLNSQEQERKRIARELHDETAQTLIILGRRIEDAQIEAGDTPLVDSLGELRDMVDDTLQGVRRFTSDLRPPLLEELGLPNTIEILGRRTARDDDLDVRVSIEGIPRPLQPDLELALYRLAQEGLSNVRRHAKARRVDLTLRYEDQVVALTIEDDGAGFELPEDHATLVATGKLGIMGIFERARLLGGVADIVSETGKGTKVRVIMPVNTQASKRQDTNDTHKSPQ